MSVLAGVALDMLGANGTIVLALSGVLIGFLLIKRSLGDYLCAQNFRVWKSRKRR